MSLFEEVPITIEDLVEEAKACTDCPLHESVDGGCAFYDGDTNAEIMFIGEAPGENEAKQGIPFVGKAGKLLRSALDSAGLTNESWYITNVCKHRPTKNRTPTTDEQRVCSSKFLVRELQIVQPKVIVPLGNPATKFFLGDAVGITRRRGNWGEWEGTPVFPMFHPAYVLRNPQRTHGSPADLFWRDLKTLKQAVDARAWEKR